MDPRWRHHESALVTPWMHHEPPMRTIEVPWRRHGYAVGPLRPTTDPEWRGRIMGTPWRHHEHVMVTPWMHREPSIGTPWTHHGLSVVRRSHHGGTMDTAWRHHGHAMESPWRPHGDAIGTPRTHSWTRHLWWAHRVFTVLPWWVNGTMVPPGCDMPCS